MTTAPTLLSTKKLKPAQRSRLLAAGFAVQSYAAVTASPLAFELPAFPFQAIFTSQHGLKAFLSQPHLSTVLPLIEAVYCVGERSAQKLRKEGIPVQIVADSAAALVQAMFPNGLSAASGASANGQENRLLDSPVYYFCGNQHLKTLPDAFASAERALEVQIIYQSQAVAKAFNTAFDVLFFYSPSGVAAFCQENTIGTAFVVAIGPTTAAAVALHTKNYTVANRPSFAHMLSALRAHYPHRLNKKTP